jgi:hypothetical protein
MARNGLVRPQEQQHGPKYKRWQRDAPMQLWQLDIVGGVPLADGREAKIGTGIDDCSRFVTVLAKHNHSLGCGRGPVRAGGHRGVRGGDAHLRGPVRGADG